MHWFEAESKPPMGPDDVDEKVDETATAAVSSCSQPIKRSQQAHLGTIPMEFERLPHM